MQYEPYRRPARGNLALNLTPLIDIVFLLLVFFMLTAHFVEDRTMDVNLPEAQTSGTPDAPHAVDVVLDSKGHITVDGKVVSKETLDAAIATALQKRHTRALQLRGDRDAHLGATVAVMDAARKAHIESLDIVTRQP